MLLAKYRHNFHHAKVSADFCDGAAQNRSSAQEKQVILTEAKRSGEAPVFLSLFLRCVGTEMLNTDLHRLNRSGPGNGNDEIRGSLHCGGKCAASGRDDVLSAAVVR
jgi:hypothetical protein